MFFTARKVLHRSTEAVVVQGSNIHLQAFPAELHTRLVGTAAEYFLHFGVGGYRLQRGSGIGPGYQQVQIPDRFLPAPQTPRRSDRINPLQ